jgi:uncharacterized protein (DUF4415 family)
VLKRWRLPDWWKRVTRLNALLLPLFIWLTCPPKLTRRLGRQKAETTKVSIAIRLSPDVVDYFKTPGAGWQSRIDAAMHEWMLEHPLKQA